MKSILLKLVSTFVIGILLLIIFSRIYVDWLWFNDLGYDSLFWVPFINQTIIQFSNGVILFLLIFGTLLSAKYSLSTFYNEKLEKTIRLVEEKDDVLSSKSKKDLLQIIIVSSFISVFVSVILGFNGWLDILYFLNSTPFQIMDPLYGHDLSFYIFKLPLLLTIYNAYFPPILILTFFTSFFYISTKVIRFHSLFFWKKNSISINVSARIHLGILLSILFGMNVFGYYLNRFTILYSQEGNITGAGYSEVFATLPALKVLLILSFIGLVLSLISIFHRDARLITMPIPILIVFSILISGVYPSLLQSIVVNSNELQKESEYISRQIRFTRYAFGLDKIEEKEYVGTGIVSKELLKKEVSTLNNIQLNNIVIANDIFEQKQAIRLFYKFNDIDIDRYNIYGQQRKVMLAPREMSIKDLDPKAQTFMNTRYKYTHGFGLAASFTNTVNSKGLPSFVISGIPPQSNYSELTISEPRIYFGELTNDWVVVNTSVKEFDYPQGNDNAENDYRGESGISLNLFNKMMISLNQATLKFFLSNDTTSKSKILLHRNVLERVQKLAPFLVYDDNPYVVIDNGRIKWMIDAYTTADSMPYSKLFPGQNFNYIRSSIKVVVDAYDGKVDFYAMDYEDPILQTIMKVFPGVFKDIAQIPYSLKAHLKYPEKMFKIQTDMLRYYHMTNTKVFYNNEDAWSPAKELYGSESRNVEPYYQIQKLPGESYSEFVMIQPFTPASSQSNARNNMVAWLAVRMDGNHYGEMVLYKLPKTSEIDGPFLIESRIDQDPDISRQISLWNQKGSTVIRGSMLTIPIADSFLFVEPIYLQSTADGSLPELVRVIVAFEDKLVMATKMEDALKSLFGRDLPELTISKENFSEEVSNLEQTELTKENPEINELLQQIQRLREIIDSLENQLTNNLTNESEYAEGR